MSENDERSNGLQRAPSSGPAGSEDIPIKLVYRRPLPLADLLEFLGRRAVSGVEHYSAGRYRRIVPLRHGHAVVELFDTGDHLGCLLELQDRRDLATAESRCRRLLDLDADWQAIESVLATDPALRELLAAKPGLRIPGAMDADELAIRAVLGQQVSVAAARTIAGRLVAAYGEPLEQSDGILTHLWPRSSMLAQADLKVLGMPNSRREAVRGLARVLADGLLQDGEAKPSEVRRHLLALPGIGPWTASYIEMRALSNADAFLSSDLGVIKGAEILGLPVAPLELERHAERWRPWRAYALQYLWAAAATTG